MIRYSKERWFTMKKTFLSILFLCICLICPLQATTLTQANPTLKLNNLTYTPIHPALITNETLYVSAEDLASLTYGILTSTDDTTLLTIQDKKISFTDASRYIKVDGITKMMPTSTLTHNEVTYLPITLLDTISYPYTLSENGTFLSITPLPPYSLATDTAQSHIILSTHYKTLEEIFDPLIIDTSSSALIHNALINNQYLSFISTTYKKDAFARMKKMLPNDKQIKVHFRSLNTSSNTPTLSTLTTYPLQYTLDTNGLNLQLGEHKLAYTCFWSTYNPDTHTTNIDLNKSLDVMIMRRLYEYYRDQYDLKDDLNLSPIIKVQKGRSDAISYLVYLDQPDSASEYKIIIYKESFANAINYYVDFYLPD